MNDMTVGVGEARKRWRWTGLDLEPHTPHEVPGPSDEPYRTVLDGVLLYVLYSVQYAVVHCTAMRRSSIFRLGTSLKGILVEAQTRSP